MAPSVIGDTGPATYVSSTLGNRRCSRDRHWKRTEQRITGTRRPPALFDCSSRPSRAFSKSSRVQT